MNTCGILASSKVPNKSPLEPDGEKQTQSPPPKGYTGRRNVSGMNVEFMRPLMPLPKICNTQYKYIPILF